jgi:hypothetical protein
LPPSEDDRLARIFVEKASFFDPIEYLRVLTPDEFTSLLSAKKHLKSGGIGRRRGPSRRSNFRSTCRRPSSASPTPSSVDDALAERSLVSLPLVWRMAID